MTRESPLRKLHQQAEASFRLHPPDPEAGVEVVDTYGDDEGEYAALRDGCVLLDRPERGVIRVLGDDRLDFLDRMFTQELKGLTPHRCRRSFWLNRKGRIDADLRVIALEDSILLDVDIEAAARTMQTLGNYIITEDVRLEDESDRTHRLALHGPASLALLCSLGAHVAGAPLSDLTDGAAAVVNVAGCDVLVDRQDATGEPGLELFMTASDAPAVYEQILERGWSNNNGHRLRPAGWRTFDVARLEGDWPLYLVDFGADSLPHETGVLKDRVSFTKGCFLGQEIVARMQSLGRPKRMLVRLLAAGAGVDDRPARGDRVIPGASPEADPVGTVTTAAASPQRGGAFLCFAQVKTEHASPGSTLLIAHGENRFEGIVV